VKTTALLLLLAALGCKSKPAAPAAPAAPVAAAGPTLVLYMPGGHLEDSTMVRGSWSPDEGTVLKSGLPGHWGAASDDLRELAQGLASPEVRGRVSVWVAFGGAVKTGWRGIRYADAACLGADAANGHFGDAGCYAFADPAADLSKPETLARFLEFVKARLNSTGPNVLVLWGQGGAHEGVLYDTVHQEIPFMRLPELRQALQRAGARFDVLGLDTPMMASLEAVEVTRPFTRLVVASPDRAPGHGWDYRGLLRKLAEKGADATGVARAAADGFMDGDSLTLDDSGARKDLSHRQSRGKSVSVIDTAKIPAVIARLDGLVGGDRRAWPRLTTAFLWAPPAGRERRSDTTQAVDLGGAARAAKGLIPSLAGKAEALIRAIDEAVPYSRRDPQVIGAPRLTIFSPASDKLWRAGYDRAELVSPAWRTYLEHQMARPRADTKAPVIKAGRGLFQISDDRRLAQLTVLRTESKGSGLWRAVQSGEPTMLTATEEGHSQTVKVPAWDDRVLWLCNGTCEHQLAVPTHPEGTLASGHRLLSAPALVRDAARKTDGEDATLFVELDGDTVVDHWLAPTELDTENRVLFSREQYLLRAGLSIAFFALERDDPQIAPGFKRGDFLDLTSAPRWQIGPLGRSVETLLAAEDPNHNQAWQPVSASRTGPKGGPGGRSSTAASGPGRGKKRASGRR
jgi:hypothetical protein